MIDSRLRHWLTIVLTFVAALVLEILPLPAQVVSLRPEWLAMTAIYWSMALPRHVGIGAAWTAGIFLDVARGALLGQHALGLAMIAFLALRFHQRLRHFPLWQMSIGIGAILTPALLLILWVHGITGRVPDAGFYWRPLLTSMLVWPVVFFILRGLRRRFCMGLG